MEELKINCKGTLEVSLSEVNLIQGDLKSLSEKNFNKLKNQLFTHGFIAPFFVSKIDGKIFLIDGHQRFRVINELIDKDELSAPERFPAVLIEASDLEDAKKKLLAITSQYGKISKDSFLYFTDEIEGLDFSECYSFDAFNIDDLFSKDDGNESEVEIDVDTSSDKEVTCPYCQKSFSIDNEI